MNKGIKKSGKVCFIFVLMIPSMGRNDVSHTFCPTPQLEMTFVVLPENAHLAHSGAGMLFDKNVKMSRIFFLSGNFSTNWREAMQQVQVKALSSTRASSRLLEWPVRHRTCL